MFTLTLKTTICSKSTSFLTNSIYNGSLNKSYKLLRPVSLTLQNVSSACYASTHSAPVAGHSGQTYVTIASCMGAKNNSPQIAFHTSKNYLRTIFPINNRPVAQSSKWSTVHGFRYLSTTAGTPDSTKSTSTTRGIQKDVSPLTVKRTVRRKKSEDSTPTQRDQEYFSVTAYAAAEEYNLEALKENVEKRGLYSICKLPEDALDALHIQQREKIKGGLQEVFFFREGSVVFWNIPDEEQQKLLEFVRPHQDGSYDSSLVHQEVENLEFTFTDTKTRLERGEIHLHKIDPQTEQAVQQMEIYAFSNALSLSVKLAVWEASLSKYVDSIEWVLQDLKDGKKIRMSEAEVLQKAGELFALGHLINLSSDLLDTPDFYWDREELEKLYIRVCNHFNIARRTKVMNEKLGQCKDLTELLRDHLKDKHHTRLELMIIILIMIEVGFEIFHLIESYCFR